MNILSSTLLYVLAATTLVPYAAAQSLRHSSGKGSDASAIDAVSVLSVCFILMSILLTSPSDRGLPSPRKNVAVSDAAGSDTSIDTVSVSGA